MITIYKIENKLNKKVYVGQTDNFHRRKRVHLNMLKKGNHKNEFLQNDYNDYGNVFTFEILETCTPTENIEREVFWTSKFDNLYNLKNGHTHHAIVKQKISESNKGLPSKLKGVPRPEYVKEKIKKSHLGSKRIGFVPSNKIEFTEEDANRIISLHVKNKMSVNAISQLTGFGRKPIKRLLDETEAYNPSTALIRSDECKKKLSVSAKNRKVTTRMFSDEQIRNIRSLRDSGMQFKDIATIYASHWKTISRICAKLSYRHVD